MFRQPKRGIKSGKKRSSRATSDRSVAFDRAVKEKREQQATEPGELSIFEQTILQSNIFQYLQQFLELQDVSKFSQVSKRTRDLVAANISRHPDLLLQRLSVRGQKQLGLFIQSHADQLAPIGLMVRDDANKHGAYAFYALMVHDVNALDDKRLQAALKFLQEKQFPQEAIDSLQFIIDFKRRGKEGLLQLLAPQNMMITQKATFFYMNLAGADLSGVELTAKNFRGCNLVMTNLQDANVMFSHFSSANLLGANLERANMTAVNFHGANMRGCNCVGAQFTSADLIDVDARGALFCKANLSMSDLTKANVQDADFSYANLTSAKLGGVNFRGVNLTGVNLSCADITNAKFVGAQFFGMKSLKPDSLHELLEHYERRTPKSLHKIICTNLIRTIFENQLKLTPQEMESLFSVALSSSIFYEEKYQTLLKGARATLLSPDLKPRQSVAEQADLLEEQLDSPLRKGNKK